MNAALASHDRILRDSIAAASGVVFSTAGDAFAAAFHSCDAAIDAAVDAQRRLSEGSWTDGIEPKVRMGIHVGNAFERDANYFGPSVNRTARLMSCAHGGQVVISDEALATLAEPLQDLAVVELGSHWLPDLPEPMKIWQIVIGGLRSDFPPLDTLSPPPPRVPRYRTTFVGREEELSKLRALIEDVSLVTIVAVGGTGKTRLACRAATMFADAFPDGVFAIELADGGPEDVAVRASEAVLGEAPIALNEDKDPVRALVTYLADRRSLLVVDNCEHVLGAARTLITAIENGCSDVRIIATSREVLGLDGETVLPLRPLPAEGDAEIAPAVELFLDRAAAAKADLELDAHEVAAVQETCRRLEGLPLALELAAARVRTLTPSKILARLNDSFDVLRQRAPVGPDRHRSLEAAIWWSWNLLDPDEQRLLSLMSVFVGGFSLEALEAMETEGAADDVLDALESLVDKSLVASEMERYRLAEPIRQFAAARLQESGKVDEAIDAHLRFFYGLAKAAAPDLDGAAEASILKSLQRDHENLLAAIERARGRGDVASAARLAGRLHVYWEETGHLSIGLRVLESIVEQAPNDPSVLPAFAIITSYAPMCGDLRRGEELTVLIRSAIDAGLPKRLAGLLRFNLAFVDIAAARMDTSIELYRTSGQMLVDEDPAVARNALWCTAYVASMADRFEEAREALAAAEAIQGTAPGWFAPMVELTRAVIIVLEGASGEVATVERLVRALDDLGLRFRLILASVAAAHAAFRAGRLHHAERFWRRGLAVAEEMGNLWGAWLLLEFAAWTAAEEGAIEAAANLWGAVDAFSSERGFARWTAIEQAAVARRDAARAIQPARFAAEVATGTRMTLHDAVGTALGSLAERRANVSA